MAPATHLHRFVVARLPPEILLEICILACKDTKTANALRCVSKNVSALVRDFCVAAAGQHELIRITENRRRIGLGGVIPTGALLLCDCPSSQATREYSDYVWDIRRYVTETAATTQSTEEIEERIAKMNARDNAKMNDTVLLNILGCFGTTLCTLKIMLILPHQPNILLDFLDKADMSALERLAIAAPDDLFTIMRKTSVDDHPLSLLGAALRFPSLKIFRLNVMGLHPQRDMVQYLRLFHIHTPRLESLIIEAYPIMGIVHGKNGVLKWVKDMVVTASLVRVQLGRTSQSVEMEILPLIGDDMKTKSALAFKEKILSGELNPAPWGYLNGVRVKTFCKTVPSYNKWKSW